jgi:hypothetical protein
MKIEELEARLKTLEDQNRTLQDRVRTIEDIEEINRLQRCYGYYLEHVMVDEMAELWADDGEMQWVGFGTFKGKGKIRQAWAILRGWIPTYGLHLAIQVSPIVDVAPDGKTAKGRWYGIVGGVMGGRRSSIQIGIYENKYVKQDGVWKIKLAQYGGLFDVKSGEDMVDPEDTQQVAAMQRATDEHFDQYPFDIRQPEPYQDYPSAYIRPFHFKHPVTGKKTNVGAWNASHKADIPPGGEKWAGK